MAHIPYYGEDVVPTPCGNIKRNNTMIFNYNQFVQHNKKFYNDFIDLKVVGWKSYSKSLNTYTMNYFREQLETADSVVEQTAKIMKGAAYDK